MKRYAPAKDMRSVFARPDRRPIGTQAKKSYVTWHYNGPSIDTSNWTEEKHIWWIRDIIIPNHISRIRADGVQYHAYILPNGDLWQLRDFDAVLWHCSNYVGNGYSLAVHVPIGGDDAPTSAQVRTLRQFTDEMIDGFDMAGREVATGHQEWRGAATACPGPHLMAELRAYRSGQDLDTPGWYRVRLDYTRVRQGPGTNFPVADIGDGEVKLKAGDTFLSDGITIGQTYDNSPRWVHRADGIGFIHESLLERL